MKLTELKLKNTLTPGKHFDGGGMYLLVKEGARYWRLKYRFADKEKTLALGVYPEVTLKEARAKRDEARKLIRDGKDPSATRQASKAAAKSILAPNQGPTLEAVTRAYWDKFGSTWAPITLARMQSIFKREVFPAMGERTMASIKPLEVSTLIEALQGRGVNDVAVRTLSRIKEIFRWAASVSLIEVNTMQNLKARDVIKSYEKKHRRMLPWDEMPQFLAKLDEYNGGPSTALALRFLLLTGTRNDETRSAVWSEFDLERAMWVIPAKRMKMKREHKVPLSRQALQVLERIRQINPHGDLVFPTQSYRAKPLSENTLKGALTRMGYKEIADPHGFRASFSTLANTSRLWTSEAIERQLTHTEKNKVKGAYDHAEHLEQRTEMMQWWADQLDAAYKSNVVKLTPRRKKA